MSKQAAIKTKGGFGPSGLDTDNWQRILISNQLSSSSLDLRISVINVTKSLCNTNIHLSNSGADNSLAAFTASRLKQLKQNSGGCPISVGEVLHRISGKVIMYKEKKDVKNVARSLQVSADQDPESEAAIHAIHDIYQQDETEAALLVHSNNAFSSINRKVMLHNISVICPLTNNIVNCYIKPVRIFIVGNHEINSREGKIQGDPTAMGAFTSAVSPLIHFLSKLIFICEDRSKEVAFSSSI